jgi:hypothetical protein
MKKQKLISDTGTGKKIVINLELAEKNLSEGGFNTLMGIIDHLQYVQKNI